MSLNMLNVLKNTLITLKTKQNRVLKNQARNMPISAYDLDDTVRFPDSAARLTMLNNKVF